ncbi:MAG: hypothetical protein IT331_07350 [Anaerolineae bacterium]|nr:hypothetical protein [Anaerolineae bacterium]
MNQSPIFSKTYDFVAWLIPLTCKFPRQHRFVMAAALQRDTLRFQELLKAKYQTRPIPSGSFLPPIKAGIERWNGSLLS